MSTSQFPLISGATCGRPLRCAPDVYPVYQELIKARARGNHWARLVIKELASVSAGRLLKYSSRSKPLASDAKRHVLSLVGVQFLVDSHSNGLYVLSGLLFDSNSTIDAVRSALRANASVNVAPAIATTLSSQGETFLKDIEELRLKPYDDQSGEEIDAWVQGATVGYGHLIPKPEWPIYKNGITESQAETLFKSDISSFVNAVNRYINTPLNSHQFDALVLLAFNIGISGFSKSSVVKLINDSNAATPYASIEDAWKAWRISQGEVNQGLINRRAAEWKIYTKGVYQRW